MKKNSIFRLVLLAVATFSLQSCRTEDELIQTLVETPSLFQTFTSKNGEPVNYPQGYRNLLEKYDSIHGSIHTRKAFIKKRKAGKAFSGEYIELGIRSQELMMKNNSERWILYARVKDRSVTGIAVGILKNGDASLEFWRLDPEDAYYKEVINLFRLAYTQKLMNEGRVNKGGGCGWNEESPCSTGEVVITVPKPNGPKGDPNLYLPGQGGGGSDPGVIGGGCGMYGDCGGGGSGAGENPNNITDDPCVKAVAANNKAKDLLDQANVKTVKDKLIETIGTDTNEKAFSFGKDLYGNYKTTPMKTGTTGNSVGVTATTTGMTIEGGAHTHTTTMFSCFSPGDFFALHTANTANSAFQYFYVFSHNAGYAMVITNPERFKDFLTNLPSGSYDATTGDWKEGSSIHLDFNTAFQQFKSSGIDEDLAFEYATAMVMSKYDMGVSLSKQDAGGNFNSVFVQENQINIPIVPGVSVPVSTYQKTEDCNLKNR